MDAHYRELDFYGNPFLQKSKKVTVRLNYHQNDEKEGILPSSNQ
ncbi:hypothetical protein JCM19238_3079 [Vibrio ponticus]|nr:hypothetical protein JCM19238_3079 [Vibrio ponticus]